MRRLTDPLARPVGSIRGAHRTDAIGLTFDDGPTRWTRPLLDVLADHGATATFFVLADRAEADPTTVRLALERGHEVGLHGADHQRLTTMPPPEVRAHLAEGRRRLTAVTGERPRWFRPPYGSQSVRTWAAARREGLDVVVWSADADDWIDHDPADIAQLALERTAPGGVLLLHDGFVADPAAPLPEPTFDRAAALDTLLTSLAQTGRTARSIGALLTDARAHRTAWFRP